MQRLSVLLGVILITLLVAASAGAEFWWTSQYELTGNRDNWVYDPNFPPPVGPVFSVTERPITGTASVVWGAPTLNGPITQGRLVGGDVYVLNTDTNDFFMITGKTHIALLPPHPGLEGVIVGDQFQVGTVDTRGTGYMHCWVGACGLIGMTQTVPRALTPTTANTGPFELELGTWTFNSPAVAGVGTLWTAPWQQSTRPAHLPTTPYTIVSKQHYLGKEISRVPLPEPGSIAILLPGVGLLGVLGWLRLRRR